MAKNSNLRDKYKPAKLVDLKKKVQGEDSVLGSSSSGKNDYLEIEEGKSNKFRLFPAHDGVDFYVMRKRYWLTVENDEGEPVKRTVLDSRVHGGTKKDVIAEYIKWCENNIKDKEKLDKVKDWKTGLTAQHHFIAYALKINKEGNEFGLLEFKKTIRDAINKATFIEDEDEPIEVDPFTDLDEGLPLIIKYNSKPNKKKGEDYYDVVVAKKPHAISDEELQLFDQAKPLVEMFHNVYKLSNFELALEGLKYFDAENEIDAFDDDSWLEIVEEVKAQFDGDSDEEDEKPKNNKNSNNKEKAKTSSKKTSKQDEDEEEDEEEDGEEDGEDEEIDLDEMDRDELKEFIKENNLDIKVKKSDDDDDIRDMIRKEMSEDESDEEDEEDEDEEDEDLDAIRARLRGKK